MRSMTAEQRADQTEIRALIERWARAVQARDTDAVLAGDSEDIEISTFRRRTRGAASRPTEDMAPSKRAAAGPSRKSTTRFRPRTDLIGSSSWPS
jgi:hypothetical protein